MEIGKSEKFTLPMFFQAASTTFFNNQTDTTRLSQFSNIIRIFKIYMLGSDAYLGFDSL